MMTNKKGAALMQVLLITVILAGIAAMLLRVSLSRTVSARKTRRAASATVLIEACMAEVNALWSAKSIQAFNRDLEGDDEGPYMYCTTLNASSCTAAARDYTCSVANPYDNSNPYQVKAFFKQEDSDWKLVYEVINGSDNL